MKSAVLVGAAAVASVSAYENQAAGEWIDLFTPPFFQDAPVSMMMNIDCKAKDACFFNGGTSSSPMSVYRSSEEHFKNVSRLEVDKDLMLLGLAMESETVGVSGGLGIMIGGTYYTTDGKNFQPSTGEYGMMQTQAMYSLGSNKFAMVNSGGAEGPNGGGVGLSTDGGKTYKGFHTFEKLKTPTGASARYGAFPTSDVWYVSGGCWPPSNNTAEYKAEYHHITQHIKVNKLTKKVTVDPLHMLNQPAYPAPGMIAPAVDGSYTAVIAKTSDAGATWELQYSSTGEFYFNQIDCASADVCMAVGEGFAHDGSSSPGAHVFGTTDGGKTWTDLHTVPGGAGMTINMLSASEAWVGVTEEGGAGFLHTTDGGKTFVAGAPLRGTGAIMSASFIDDKTAYAASITNAQDCTVLALGVSKPTPGPGPAPGGAFTQTQCSDSNCSVGCSSHAFPENQCIKTTSGGSAKVLCSKDGKELITQDYTSTDCSGSFKNQTEANDQCFKSSSGGSFENSCTSKSFAVLANEFTGLKLF